MALWGSAVRAACRGGLGIASLALLAACAGEPSTAPTPSPTPTPTPTPTALTVPAIAREFRGLWIATVANIDWPTSTTLSASQQQAELLTIFNLARTTGLNAVVLQVRASGDALFASSLEPWSKSLTGTQGGNPGWDPLAFAVREAHARGLELHAWFNPFRAGNLSDSLTRSPLHFARQRPDLTRPYCGSLWFDPGEDAVHNQTIAVIKDVALRYDVDAIHLDDFFYPYPDTKCPNLDFPDSVTFARYQTGGGQLGRADWRRANINRFVERLYTEAHALRPSIRVGISPFGIWRPGNPAGITGLDAYSSIYADSRLWLQQGWVDYLAPQLYWSIASTGQSFPALLDWWGQQNTKGRHLWPGLAAYRVADGTSSAFAASEITTQIERSRQRSGSLGTILYNTTSVRLDKGGLATALAATTNATPAITPATPWLDNVAPAAPTITAGASTTSGQLTVRVTNNAAEVLSWWLVRWRTGSSWSQRLVPWTESTIDIPAASGSTNTDAVVVTAIDRAGNASPDAIWRTP